MKEVLQEIDANIRGLRLEVEGWRKHTSSNGTFVMDQLDELERILKQLRDKLK